MPAASDGQPDARPDISPSGVEIGPGVRVPGGAIRFAFVRSSGPGGQGVNKRSTKARLRVALDDIPISAAARARLVRRAGSLINEAGEIVIQDESTRSTERNRRACEERLWEMIAGALVAPKKRTPTKPTKGSVRRRLEEKKQRSQTKSRRRRTDDS